MVVRLYIISTGKTVGATDGDGAAQDGGAPSHDNNGNGNKGVSNNGNQNLGNNNNGNANLGNNNNGANPLSLQTSESDFVT